METRAGYGNLIFAVILSLYLHGDAASATAADSETRVMAATALGDQLQVGDVVFIRIPHAPFTKVAETTMSWSNHVGIVSDVRGEEPLVAESRVPVAGETRWSSFVQRSEQGRVAVMRLPTAFSEEEKRKLRKAIAAREGVMYDTGFDLHSRRQFCSRYVREVVAEAKGETLGEVENFQTLLARNPQADLAFWRAWYFGDIPWQRETVTPASLLNDGKMRAVFEGYAR